MRPYASSKEARERRVFQRASLRLKTPYGCPRFFFRLVPLSLLNLHPLSVRLSSYPVYSDAVAYCMRQFRSYDPYSMTYLGYDGRRHPCP